MRSVAVICVLTRHILGRFGNPNTPFFQTQALGIFGVMLFFVHTSLVLLLSIERKLARTGESIAESYLPFIVRRAFRIYPLSIAIVLLVWFVLPTTASDMGILIRDHHAGLSDLAINLGLLNGMFHLPFVLGTLWTLPIELQMYLVLPLVYILAVKADARKLAWIWIASVAIAVSFRYVLHRGPVFLGYAPCFCAGAIAFRMPVLKRLSPMWLPVLMGVVLLAYMVLYGRTGWEVPLGWCVCLAFGIALPQIVSIRLPWLNRASELVATYSYGIYLTHISAISFGFALGRNLPIGFRVALTLVITGIASAVAYHLVEKPMIRVGAEMADRVRMPSGLVFARAEREPA